MERNEDDPFGIGEDNTIDMPCGEDEEGNCVWESEQAEEEFRRKFAFMIMSQGSSSDYRNDRDRPYNGQSHTDQGERGKQEVMGLTMRDMKDCYVMGYLEASGKSDLVENGEWRYSHIYECDAELDPLAVAQNMLCHVERMMGIFPNLPGGKIEEVEK